MIKGINQSMVNRSIAGGGVTCKCVGGNGISGDSNGSSGNGSGVSGGKIEVEFTVYTVDEEAYVMQEDAKRIFNEILGVDLEKYIIYLCAVSCIYNNNNKYTVSPCMVDVSANSVGYLTNIVTEGPFKISIAAYSYNNYRYNDSSILIGTHNNITISSDISTTDSSTTYKLTLYYRER